MKVIRKDGNKTRAWLWDGSRKNYDHDAPDWVKANTNWKSGILILTSSHSAISCMGKTYIIEGHNGDGCYPCTEDYFKNHYSLVKDTNEA